MKRWNVLVAVVVCGLVAAPSEAAAWDLFESENPDVRDGNERMAAGDAAGAVSAYERALRALPSEPAVHLDHGLALLEAGQLDAAREALRLATEPPATAAIRGAAHYDLGLAFYRQADAAAQAEEPDHEQAQRLFREAADAFRSSLRQVPGNRDAGWNLELALRRIQEQQAEQEREEQEQEQQEEQEQQDGEQQDGEQQDGEQQDGEQQDGEQQDGEQQDGEQQDGEPEQEEGEGEGEEAPEGEEPGEQEADDQEAQDSRDPQPPEGEGAEGTEEQDGAEDPESTGSSERSMPPDMARVLDALEDGEESLERARARARGQREQRRVVQDW